MYKYINILIVDDNLKTQIGLKEILYEKETNILISESYEDALTIVSRKKIGIIFLNIDSETYQKPTYIKKVINLIINKVGFGKANFGKIKYRALENMELYADISKARKFLKWRPTIRLDEGLKLTINSIQKK